MTDLPPTLDYQKPDDQNAQRWDTPLPKLGRGWVLLCWLPPILAVLLSCGILNYYGGLTRIRNAPYMVQQWLLYLAFWWVVVAYLARLIRVIVLSW
jgi:hypothetical protein